MQVHHPYTSLLRTALLSVLRQEGMDQELPASSINQREMLGDTLIASNSHWKQETLQLIDELYELEQVDKIIVGVNDLDWTNFHPSSGTTRVGVWKGDICSLQVDAIVNAANEYGEGCFQPHHKCIDNVIHRHAGPRLRIACRDAMMQRRNDGALLTAGTTPILTDAFHLPSKYVIHATGPQIHSGVVVTEEHKQLLASAYEKSLDMAAQHGVKCIAFPCISTGLFGFPLDLAAEIALSTVQTWLQEHPNTMDNVVFNVFTEKDDAIYRETIGRYFQDVSIAAAHNVNDTTDANLKVQLARTWLEQADAVLICAGAGMSVKEGEMVYTNPDDFRRAYPWFPKWGYKTSYQVMGLEGDPSVPRAAKWALYSKHMDNMRWKFTPNDGYETLLGLVQDKDYFVLTSNVDACFERSGFDKDRIYTPQGEWTYLQCQKPCRSDSVFESRPYLDRILPNISNDGFIPDELIPKCPRCGSDMFGNVRAGNNFLHTKYEAQNDALRAWMQSLVDSKAKVVVIEVGAGFNTPTVTRFPVESFVRDLGDQASLIRINPTEAFVPDDVKAIGMEQGWQVLGDIAESDGLLSEMDSERVEQLVRDEMLNDDLLQDDRMTIKYGQYFGHFDWRRFLLQLKNHL